MIDLKQYEFWFITAASICMALKLWSRLPSTRKRSLPRLGASKHIPVKVVFKPVLTTPDAIRDL